MDDRNHWISAEQFCSCLLFICIFPTHHHHRHYRNHQSDERAFLWKKFAKACLIFIKINQVKVKSKLNFFFFKKKNNSTRNLNQQRNKVTQEVSVVLGSNNSKKAPRKTSRSDATDFSAHSLISVDRPWSADAVDGFVQRSESRNKFRPL